MVRSAVVSSRVAGYVGDGDAAVDGGGGVDVVVADGDGGDVAETGAGGVEDVAGDGGAADAEEGVDGAMAVKEVDDLRRGGDGVPVPVAGRVVTLAVEAGEGEGAAGDGGVDGRGGPRGSGR